MSEAVSTQREAGQAPSESKDRPLIMTSSQKEEETQRREQARIQEDVADAARLEEIRAQFGQGEDEDDASWRARLQKDSEERHKRLREMRDRQLEEDRNQATPQIAIPRRRELTHEELGAVTDHGRAEQKREDREELGVTHFPKQEEDGITPAPVEEFSAEIIDAKTEEIMAWSQAFERGKHLLAHARQPEVAAGIAAGMLGIASMVAGDPVLAEISMVGGLASAVASRGKDAQGKLRGAAMGAGLALGGAEAMKHLPFDQTLSKAVAGAFDDAILILRGILGALSVASKLKK